MSAGNQLEVVFYLNKGSAALCDQTVTEHGQK
jgi:hypothetical protein